MIRLCARLLFLGVITGCGTVREPAAPVPRSAVTEVNASFAKTWDAVIDQFSTQNIPIKTVDRSSGIIASELLRVGPDIGDVADCGTDILGPPLIPTEASYNILVRGDSVRSTVRVTVRWIRVGMARGMSTETVTEDCTTKSVWEPQFEAHIRAAAEGKK